MHSPGDQCLSLDSQGAPNTLRGTGHPTSGSPAQGSCPSFSTQGLCFLCFPLGAPLRMRLLQCTRPRPLTPHPLSCNSAWDPVGLTPRLTSLLPRVLPLTTQKLSWMLTVSPTPDCPGESLPKLSAPAGQRAQISFHPHIHRSTQHSINISSW